MNEPFSAALERFSLNDDFLRLLAASKVRDRLAFLENGLAALADQQPRIVQFHQGKMVVDICQARALSRYFVNDPSRQVRRRLAQRLGELDWQDWIPLVARLVWDQDDRVRQLAARTLDQAQPVLTYLSHTDSFFGIEPAIGLGRRGAFKELAGGPPLTILVDSGERAFQAYDAVVEPIATAAAPAPAAEIVLPASAAPPPPPPPGTRSAVSREEPPAGEEIVRRYTDCDFTADPELPSSGKVTFALRIQAAGPESRPVDLRVPAGKSFTTVLVHAFSHQFTVTPEIWFVKVPRAVDSEVAEFVVRAEKPGEGEVGLLVYDEYRLIGSLSVRLRAVETPQGLILEKVGTILFRDPAPTAPTQSNGITVQVSLTGPDSRVAFHLLLPLAEGKDWQPSLFPLGRSGDAMEAASVQAALAALRAAVDEIEQGLEKPESLGAATAGEALQAIRLNLEGAGRQIGEDIIAPAARAVLAHLRPGSVVHWVIRDSKLDAVPWELAWNPATGHHLNQDLVLVRVPVRDNPVHNGDAVGLSNRPALPPAPDRILYLLGDEVGPPECFPLLRDVVRSVGGYQVVTNFDGNQRQSVTVLELQKQIRDAKIVHLLCHGLVEEDKGLFLKIENHALGRLTPVQVRGFDMPPNSTVFVNACSSSAATFSLTGLTSFGWSFLRAGARAYIGSLAPVTTTVALAFAQALLEAHLEWKLPLTQAVFEARQRLARGEDPTWLLYTLYGDLSQAPATETL